MGTYLKALSEIELSNEFQHDRVWMVLKNLCVPVLWTKVVSALEGLKILLTILTAVKLSVIRDCL